MRPGTAFARFAEGMVFLAGLMLRYDVLEVIDRYLLIGELIALCPKLP